MYLCKILHHSLHGPPATALWSLSSIVQICCLFTDYEQRTTAHCLGLRSLVAPQSIIILPKSQTGVNNTALFLIKHHFHPETVQWQESSNAACVYNSLLMQLMCLLQISACWANEHTVLQYWIYFIFLSESISATWKKFTEDWWVTAFLAVTFDPFKYITTSLPNLCSHLHYVLFSKINCKQEISASPPSPGASYENDDCFNS